RVRPRRRHAVVGHALVHRANQMRARVRNLEAEVAAGVSLSAPSFFHPLAQLDENDVISGGGLSGGPVLQRAAQGLRRSDRGKQDCERSRNYLGGKFQTLVSFRPGSGRVAACSSRAISARMPAASSSSEAFSDWKSWSGSLPAWCSKFRSRRFS